MKRFVAIGLIAAIAILSGCAGIGVKPWQERTPHEKVLTFYQIYNKQYDDTMRLAKMPGITEAQKEMIRKKKEALTKVRPLIMSYDEFVVHGTIPVAGLEERIIGLLDQLAAKGE